MPRAKRTASQVGRGSRRKGAAFEREVAAVLRTAWPEARRGLGQARAANEVSDVTGTPYWVELKHRKQLNVHVAFEQAVRDLGARALVPAVVSRVDGGETLVSMRLADWMTLAAPLLPRRPPPPAASCPHVDDGVPCGCADGCDCRGRTCPR